MEQQSYHYRRKIFVLENLERTWGIFCARSSQEYWQISFEEFKTKYNIEVNFIYYCQILSAIPKTLKLKAMTIKKPLETITEEADVYQLAEGKTIRLSEMRCKDYYSLFQVKWETQPTSVQSWSKHYPHFANKWNNLFKNISKMSADNKLRQFSFKLLHRILVTKKELKRYKIKLDDECFFVKVQILSNTHFWLALLSRTFTTK